MGMYEDRPPVGERGSRDLDQGDVLTNVLLPKLPHERSFGFQRQADKKDGTVKWAWKKDFTAKELLDQEGKELRVMSMLAREPFVIVLGNSCDNYSGEGPILVAPVRPFDHYDSAAVSTRKALSDVVDAFAPRCSTEDCEKVALMLRKDDRRPICEECVAGTGVESERLSNATELRSAVSLRKTAEEQARLLSAERWMAISRAATGANPKRFYLPADSDRGFVRSEAHLLLAQPVTASYLTKCLKELNTSRSFGLNGEAVRHLQYTIESFFGRNPRDDHAWPSREDLELKATWLELELERDHLDETLRAEYQTELAYVRGVIG